MINIHLLKVPQSRTTFHGPRGVRAIEVLLYIIKEFLCKIQQILKYSPETPITRNELI